MTMVDIETKVEIEFTSGVWTSMAAYLDAESAISWDRGVGENREPQIPTASFSLDNSSEAFTDGAGGTYAGMLKKGIGVRITAVYSATTYHRFRGEITEIKRNYPPYGPAQMRVWIECEGMTARLAAQESYAMPAQENKDVDDVMTAIAIAGAATLYSFEDSNFTLPVVVPRDSPSRDLVAVGLSEPSAAVWEDGQGRLRFKKSENMTGGYASPAHTWGTTIAPDGEVKPDYRNDSQYARQTLTLSTPKVSLVDAVLYRHPFNMENGLVEALAPGARRRISGVFSQEPASVEKKFSQTIRVFVDSTGWLYSSIDASTDRVSIQFPNSPQIVQPGHVIRIENEVMRIDSILYGVGQAVCTVTRAYLGTTATSHAALPQGGTKVYYRPSTQVLTDPLTGYTAKLTANMSATTSTSSMTTGGPGFMYGVLKIGDIVKIDNEFMVVTGGSSNTITLTRGQYGSNATVHVTGAVVKRVEFQGAEDILGPSHIRGGELDTGIPAASPDIVGLQAYANGDHMTVLGRRFTAAIVNNNTTAARYLSELVIGGKVYQESSTPVVFAYEKPIPYLLGLPEGPSLALPYGASSVEIAKGYAYGSLRAGRMPSPWLPVEFVANYDDNLVSVLTADIGDLVRYTGTGTQREGIDEWYRIQAVGESVDGDGIIRTRFKLAPSHLNRRADKCWYTDFNWHDTAITVGTGKVMTLGRFQILPSGSAGWVNDSEWDTYLGVGNYDVTGQLTFPSIARATATNPAAPIVDLGSADFVIGTTIQFAQSDSVNTFPASTGGVGFTFRQVNSGASQRWELRFNRSTSQIILWNTNAGVVGTPVSWTVPASGLVNVEVWCQGNRIRVFLNEGITPIFDVTSSL